MRFPRFNATCSVLLPRHSGEVSAVIANNVKKFADVFLSCPMLPSKSTVLLKLRPA